MKRKTLRNAALALVTLVAVSCQTDNLEEDTTLNAVQDIELDEAVGVALSTGQCGTAAAPRSLGSRLASIQGDRCTAASNAPGNPGFLDCRAQFRGSHTREGSWFLYNIVQGNKRTANPTAVRIERAFRAFDRPTTGAPTRVAFTGTVRVDRLPNDPDITSHSSDFTYICQMHGSQTIRDYDGPANGENHTSAIWLLRAQRTSANRFRFVLEYSLTPISASSRPNRTTITFGGDRAFGVEYDIEVHYGYRFRQNNGYILINGRRFNVPEYDFTTDRQFFRYGAYRAGRNIDAVNQGRFFNQSIIAWRNDVTFCNPN